VALFFSYPAGLAVHRSGLAADGAKLAMWNLYMVGYRIIGFIHDEVRAFSLSLLPELQAYAWRLLTASPRDSVVAGRSWWR
jgi:hypothetical protein